MGGACEVVGQSSISHGSSSKAGVSPHPAPLLQRAGSMHSRVLNVVKVTQRMNKEVVAGWGLSSSRSIEEITWFVFEGRGVFTSSPIVATSRLYALSSPI